MPYSEVINARIQKILLGWPRVDPKKMFGGTCYLMDGKMVCGVWQDYLILRIGEEAAMQALKKPHTKPFDITGRPMRGWVMVKEDGVKEEEILTEWLNKAKNFVETLPPK